MMKKMMIPLVLALAAAGFFCDHAINESDIIAYPVPFNPDTQVLKIAWSGTPVAVDRVTVTIMDINGDEVFAGTYASLSSPIAWNGRNNAGIVVDAGEYLIRVVAENTQTGYYSTGLIRILIQR